VTDKYPVFLIDGSLLAQKMTQQKGLEGIPVP